MSDQSDYSPHGGRTDFGWLGDAEIENAGDIFKQSEFIRNVASNVGLIIVQWASDVEFALASVPVINPGGRMGIGVDNPQKRARRVARHAHRAGEAMRSVGVSAAKLPPAYLKAYQDVITARRGRKGFDPRAGL